MNKEERPILYTNLEWEDVLDYNHMTWISIDRFKHLQQKNEDLQQRIDKAIEYINHFSKKSEVKINGLPDCKVFIGDIEQLLEILGGKE